MKRSLFFRLASLTAATTAALSAHALILSGVDLHPSIVSPMPSTGPFQVAITGTITASAPGEKIAGNVFAPALYNNAFLSIPMNDFSFFADAASALEATGTYTGPLFAYEVGSWTNIGRYDNYPFPGVPEHVFQSSLGSAFDATLRGFYVDVNPVGDPTPEPGTFAALGFGALCLLRRRRVFSNRR